MSEQTLRVLSVNISDAGGGASRAAYRIHHGVRELGVDSRMFVKNKYSKDANVVSLHEFVPHNPIYQAFDWTRVKVKNKIQHFYWNRYPQRDQVFMSDLRGTALNGALKKLDYDVMHLHWINQRFISLVDLPKGKPIVWTLHDSWPFCGICHYFFECEAYQRQCGCCPFLHSNKADDLSHKVWKQKLEIYNDLNLHIVSPSRWLANCAKRSGLFRKFPVEVIPNCLDTEAFCPLDEMEISPRWRNFQENSSTKAYVLYGAMNAKDKIKGYAHLLSAMKILEKSGYTNEFELIAFGVTKSDLNMNLSIPVHYVGYVSNTKELASLYNLASVMVVPSLTENLSCTIMESLSCGTPVVAFNIGGNSDMIEHRKNGYLAREFDDADLAEGIIWCIQNNADNHLGDAARKKVLGNYTFDRVCQQYKSLYESARIKKQ